MRMKKMSWKVIKSQNGENEIKYHISESDNYYVDEIEIIENGKKLNVKYQIRPSSNCDLLTIQTNGFYAEICYSNLNEHEDPFFTWTDNIEAADAYKLIAAIKSYIFEVLEDKLQVSFFLPLELS